MMRSIALAAVLSAGAASSAFSGGVGPAPLDLEPVAAVPPVVVAPGPVGSLGFGGLGAGAAVGLGALALAGLAVLASGGDDNNGTNGTNGTN